MKTTMLVIVLLAPLTTHAAVGCIGSDAEYCKWQTEDYALQSVTISTLLTDWLQTREFTRDPQKTTTKTDCGVIVTHRSGWLREVNPIIGPYPSSGRIAVYFLSSMATHTVISMLLPKPYRTIWQSSWIGVEVTTVTNNTRKLGGRFYLSVPW